ncbi:acetylxylan esterase [Streptomyces sp. NPDC058572]|uniref:poly(ethylene terephthalate) hydrolase family protein n=1 Tax=Streptomyces sp. NPDC058572 TaxID=3346546 RepID=UPI0036605EC6
MLWRKLLVPVTALLLLLTASAGAGAAAASTGAGGEAAAAGYGARGPYATAVEVGVVTTLYYPRDIATSDRRHPVIVWGNGTFAFPVVYRDLLLHWASQGFIVAAANTPLSNLGISMRAGIDLLTRRNADPGSAFNDRVDLEHIGVSGHSQGGAAAIVVGADPRIDTILPIQPGPLANINAVRVPALLLAGQKDSIAAFWFTFAGYEYPHHADPRFDLDMASYGVCRLMPDGSLAPKRSFHTMAKAYTSATPALPVQSEDGPTDVSECRA